MESVVWDFRDVIFIDFLKKYITGQYYDLLLDLLKKEIPEKGHISQKHVILL